MSDHSPNITAILDQASDQFLREPSGDPVMFYHRIRPDEDLATAVQDITALLTSMADEFPTRPYKLYIDIDGHRNDNGGFDSDMYLFQKHFAMDGLLGYFETVTVPLGTVGRTADTDRPYLDPHHTEPDYTQDDGDHLFGIASTIPDTDITA